MRRTVFCALVAFIVLASSAQGQKPTTLIGAGIRSCGTWTKSIGTPGHIEYSAWVFGYVSAYNQFGLYADSDVSRTTDGDGILGWIDRFCLDHPINQTNNLIGELQRRSGAK
jgi:hypothetical protein